MYKNLHKLCTNKNKKNTIINIDKKVQTKMKMKMKMKTKIEIKMM